MKQERLFIYLHARDAQASWIITDDTHKIIQSVADGDLNQLTNTDDKDVYVIVPAQDVLLTQATLPKLSRQRLLQALPFALEEQLIDDVDTLHFAIGEQQSDGNLSVAIISRQKITAWLENLAALGIAPRALIPAIFLLPYMPSHWQINTDHHHCLVRTGKFSGFACELDNLEILLELKLNEEPEKGTLNLIRTHLSEQQLLERSTGEWLSSPWINLLQGSYQAKPPSTKTKKIWQYAAYLAIACVTIGFFNHLVSFFMLNRQANKIEAEINQIYMRNFPQAKSIVAPRERMEDKIRKLAGQAHKNNLLALLGELGKGLSEAPGIRIQNMDFREQQLTLEVTAATFDNLDAFTRSLSQQGLAVKQQNAATVGEQVKATLMIRAGAA